MQTNHVMKAIDAIDLESVKTKLMHVASGEGWSRSKADALATEYRRFLYLMVAFPNEQTAPTVDVDTFWHYHILDTKKYAADCEVTFGYFLHHYPHLGMEGEHDAGAEQRGAERMRELYEQTFGLAYIRDEVYGVGAAAAAAFCMCRPDEPQVQVQGQSAAFCMLRPDTQQPVRPALSAAAAQAAFCMCRPDEPQVKGHSAAFCMLRPDGQSAPVRPASVAAGASAAFCMCRPDGQPGALAQPA